MKITIITVSYNAEDTIERAIYSVINQTYKDIEYIVVDGASSDKTVDIIKKYQDKITYWISEKDSGIYNAMNKGIKIAQGEYIQFLNADDFFINKDIISNIVNEIKKNNYPEILSAPVWAVDLNGFQKIKEGFLKNDIESIKSGVMLPHQGLFVKREILLKYKFDESYRIVADFEQLYRCIRDGKKIIGIDIPVVFFSLGGVSGQNDIYIKEMISIFNKYNFDKKIEDNFIAKHSRFTIKYKVKKTIKNILYKIHLLRFFKKYNGWIKHKCDNKYCKWCKNKE